MDKCAATAAAATAGVTSVAGVETAAAIADSTPSKARSASDASSRNSFCNPQALESTYEEMTLDQILNGTGKDNYYPGLIPLVYAYLDFINCDRETFERVQMYLTFISKRATGELLTPATWMRNFVRSHPKYKKDSVISQEIAFDLMIACQAIGDGSLPCPELLGDVTVERMRKEDAYGQVLPGRLSSHERSELLSRLMTRAYNPRPSHVPRGTTKSKRSFSLDALSGRKDNLEGSSTK